MRNTIVQKSLVCGILVLFVGAGVVKPGYNLTVTTDKLQYYPGETVRISGQLTENGYGVSGNVCINVTDPNEVLIDGICVPTTSEGYYWRNTTLESDAIPGVYNVTAEDEEHGVQALTSFEVVPKIICGDANNDGVINVIDAVYLINYKFLSPPGPPPLPMVCVGDANGDGVINVTDIVYLINFLFLVPPGPAPGGCCKN